MVFDPPSHRGGKFPKLQLMHKPILICLFLGLAWGGNALARGVKKGAAPAVQSEKSMNFDGDVVEGLNRRPLDSLSTNSEQGNRLGLGHTYRRQKNFDEESQELSRDLAETY